MGIRNIRHKGLFELFDQGRTAKINPKMREACLLILDRLAAIAKPDDCQGVRGFHALSGNLRGYYAMTVTKNWRIVFRWEGDAVCDVDLVDYH